MSDLISILMEKNQIEIVEDKSSANEISLEIEDKSICSCNLLDDKSSEESFNEEISSNSEDEINKIKELSKIKKLSFEKRLDYQYLMGQSIKNIRRFSSKEIEKNFKHNLNINDQTKIEIPSSIDFKDIYDNPLNVIKQIHSNLRSYTHDKNFNSKPSKNISITAKNIKKYLNGNKSLCDRIKQQKILLFLLSIYLHKFIDPHNKNFPNAGYLIAKDYYYHRNYYGGYIKPHSNSLDYFEIKSTDNEYIFKPENSRVLTGKSFINSIKDCGISISITDFDKKSIKSDVFFDYCSLSEIWKLFGVKSENSEKFNNFIQNHESQNYLLSNEEFQKFIYQWVIDAEYKLKHIYGNFLMKIEYMGEYIEFSYNSDYTLSKYDDSIMKLENIINSLTSKDISQIDFKLLKPLIDRLVFDLQQTPFEQLSNYYINSNQNQKLIKEINEKKNQIDIMNQEIIHLNDQLDRIYANTYSAIKNREVQIQRLDLELNDLERSYKSFEKFKDLKIDDSGSIRIDISEYQNLKQLEINYLETQGLAKKLEFYKQIINDFEKNKLELIYQYNNIDHNINDYYLEQYQQKCKEFISQINEKYQEKKEKLNSRREKLKEKFKEMREEYKQKKIDLELDYKQKSENLEKAINDANDKQKYWQNIIDHAEDHITSKLQKQLQEQINQFSKFNSTKWDSQVRFNIISTILKSINHKNDLIKLGIKTDELEFKNLNEVLKCIQIFNMFGLCTNDKNENILMNKFTFNFIDKINSYMKQFSVLDPDYKK